MTFGVKILKDSKVRAANDHGKKFRSRLTPSFRAIVHCFDVFLQHLYKLILLFCGILHVIGLFVRLSNKFSKQKSISILVGRWMNLFARSSLFAKLATVLKTKVNES